MSINEHFCVIRIINEQLFREVAVHFLLFVCYSYHKKNEQLFREVAVHFPKLLNPIICVLFVS